MNTTHMFHGRWLAKSLARLAWFAAMFAASARVSAAQIATGSDGSDGAFVFVQDTGPGAIANRMTIDLALAASGLDSGGQPITWQTPSPVAGHGVYDAYAWAIVFKYTSAVIPEGKTVVFANHPSRAPVVWLVQGTCTIAGEISLNGNTMINAWPEPGPGGFRGGAGRSHLGSFVSIGGFGPGGGAVGGCAGPPASADNAYSSPACFPLIGGSGTGANASGISASGSGAMLIAAGTRIDLGPTSMLRSQGLPAPSGGCQTPIAGGGCFRLVADTIVQSNTATFAVTGGWGGAGNGRVRYEANSFQGTLFGTPLPTLGPPGQLLPEASSPSLRVVSVTVAGQAHAVPADPRAGGFPTQADVHVLSTGPATILLEARNVLPGQTCTLRMLDLVGNATSQTSTPLVGTHALSTATVTVSLSPAVYALQARVSL